MARALITGSAGFIGFHLARSLLAEGWEVHGVDGLTAYYDVALKEARHAVLADYAAFTPHIVALEDAAGISETVAAARPEVLVHLAAQAGVRYALENPRAYLDGNLVGTFNLLEAALRAPLAHLLMASTSSVYGANARMPYAETDRADTPMSFYAATKKANEAMAHSWAHLHALPTTMFRFFTVYGPWGRPDMALFRFTEAILADRPVELFNHGEMRRDFTYVDDLVRAIRLLVDVVPERPADPGAVAAGDSLSPVAPFRVVNIGNSESVRLLDFVAALETALGKAAERRYVDMQPGDVPATWADSRLLRTLTGYAPQTGVHEGISRFVAWYRAYHGV